MKILFLKSSKIGHGGPTQNQILHRTTMTEFSKIFLVFFKFMSERAVFVAFAEGLKYQSTVYRRGFRNPEDNTEKAYKFLAGT